MASPGLEEVLHKIIDLLPLPATISRVVLDELKVAASGAVAALAGQLEDNLGDPK